MSKAAEAGRNRIVLDLARHAVERTAPDELVLFDTAATQFLAHGSKLPRHDASDEAVGFGLDLSMVTPVAIVVANAAVLALGGAFGEAWQHEATPVIRSWFRRIFRRKQVDRTPVAQPRAGLPPLTSEQAQYVHTVALQRALSLDLPPEKAALLADAITGGLLRGA